MSVGICGSDYHFFSGHLTDAAGGGDAAFPKIQGHEVAGTIAAVGPDCRAGAGGRASAVALWPLRRVRAVLPVQRRAAQRLRRTSS